MKKVQIPRGILFGLLALILAQSTLMCVLSYRLIQADRGDLNHDGVVNIKDLSILAHNYNGGGPVKSKSTANENKTPVNSSLPAQSGITPQHQQSNSAPATAPKLPNSVTVSPVNPPPVTSVSSVQSPTVSPQCPANTAEGAYFFRGYGPDGAVVCGFAYYNACAYSETVSATDPACLKGQ